MSPFLNELLEAVAFEALTVEELSERMHVSRRDIQAAFAELSGRRLACLSRSSRHRGLKAVCRATPSGRQYVKEGLTRSESVRMNPPDLGAESADEVAWKSARLILEKAGWKCGGEAGFLYIAVHEGRQRSIQSKSIAGLLRRAREVRACR